MVTHRMLIQSLYAYCKTEKENAGDKKISLAVQGSWSNKLSRVQYAQLIEDLQPLRDKYDITVSVDAKL